MNPQDFLDAVAGYAQGRRTGSVDRPNRIARIDPAFTPASYPGTLPRVTFEGESTMSTKRYAVVGDYVPQPGHRVLMLPVGNTYVVLGRITAPGT